MIIYKKGNIFESEAEALVNPVNCVGIMAAGLARQFKENFPFNYTLYKQHCFEGKMKPGHLFHTRGRDSNGSDRIIINFATKDHWKNQSDYEWIDKGMYRLKEAINKLNLNSLAIPALGCGLGGLAWFKVKPYIVNWMEYPEVKKCTTEIYEPTF